jgi:hypothetical protein
MTPTIQLAVRIAILWAAGFLVAVVLRALLSTESGLTFTGSKTTLFVAYGRLGFWASMLAALTGTGLVVVRAMLLDVGWSSMR